MENKSTSREQEPRPGVRTELPITNSEHSSFWSGVYTVRTTAGSITALTIRSYEVNQRGLVRLLEELVRDDCNEMLIDVSWIPARRFNIDHYLG